MGAVSSSTVVPVATQWCSTGRRTGIPLACASALPGSAAIRRCPWFRGALDRDLRQSEDPFEVQLLLVEAFLSDVARAYRRSPWRSPGARRTAYPVVLLDGADDSNGGFALLELVKEARSESHHSFDPMVFVGLAESFPKDATSGDPTRPSVVQWSASEAMDGYEAWCRGLTGRSHPVISWYLPSWSPPPNPGLPRDQMSLPNSSTRPCGIRPTTHGASKWSRRRYGRSVWWHRPPQCWWRPVPWAPASSWGHSGPSWPLTNLTTIPRWYYPPRR